MFSFAACSEGLAPEAVEGWESMPYHTQSLPPVCDGPGEECFAGATPEAA